MTNKFDINKFNSFIDAASETIACGSDCQQQKKADLLKDRYSNAQSNLLLAEPKYHIAKENYYVFVSGQSGYDDMMEQEYGEKAEMIAQKFKETYDDEINKIKTQLNSYNGLLINFRNIVDLLQQYRKENDLLFKQLKDGTNEILTNERKTFYEDQQIDSLNKSYYYILWIIYIIVVICFGLFSLFFPSQYSWKIRLFLTFIFVILPFVSTLLLGQIIRLVYWLYSYIPKNVYIEKK
jgi:hypothetical protein